MKSKPKLNLKYIDSRALNIVRRLQNEGFETYLVGGCVRDLLLGLEPKDFDIATTANPRQIKKIIKNAFIIGRRFRLVLVKDGEDQFEVSTFRRNPTKDEQNDSEISDDNLFGTSKQDAYRRDFTINALFYDPISNEVIDHTDLGVNDLKNRQIRIIGDPKTRLLEDPIRILRAIRFAHKTNCELTYDLKVALAETAYSLTETALPRRREEILKLLRLKNPASVFYQLNDLHILNYLTPGLLELFNNASSTTLFRHLLTKLNFDKRTICEPYELFSVLIIPLILAKYTPDEGYKWFKEEQNINFLKFELGLFNTEIHVLNQGFKFLPQVIQFKNYLEFSDPQKVDFLNQKGFAEALNISFLCDLISLSEISLWSNEFFNNNPKSAETPNKRKRKKKKLDHKKK